MKRFLSLAVVCFALLGCFGATAMAKTPSTGWFAGTWNTDFGAMTVTQTGTAVKGDYGVGTIAGTVSGNVLAGTWTQGSRSGKLKFTLSADGSTWKGVYGDGTAAPTQPWNGTNTRHAPHPSSGPDLQSQASSFAGKWITDFGAMTLKQTGSSVTGTYEGGGHITGTVTGRTMRGKWNQKTENGTFRFNINAAGTKFTGAFGTGTAIPQKKWNGHR